MVLRSRSLSLGLLGVSASLALSYAGCDSGGGTSSGGGSGTTTTSGDGKYYPPANGVHGTEKQACDALIATVEKKFLALHCVGTSQTCPAFLRSKFQTPCMEYDMGSVQGCTQYYNEQKSCQALKDATDDCVVTPYPGTEPAGCPMPDGGPGGSGGTGATGGTGGTGGTGAAGGTGGTGGTGGSGVGASGGSGGSGGSSAASGTGGN